MRPKKSLTHLVALVWLVAAACTTSTPEAVTTTTTTLPSTSDAVAVETTVPVLVLPAGVAPEPDESPLPIDDAVRIGVLENGLTYYVRSNQAPGRHLSVRMAVNAGSLQQVGPTDNVAHFLEHMMFNGTEAYPGNELDSTLRRLGAQIGPDLNAYTSYDETVYQLDVTATGDNVQTAFGVLREWAGRALLNPDEVTAERGVVREEFRLAREGPAADLNRLFESAYLMGTPYEDRSPIGEEDQILATEPGVLQDFYDRWYRPDNMAVIAVGDLSLDEMEQQVVDRFSDFTKRGNDHPDRNDPVIEPIAAPFVEVFYDPEQAGTYVSLDYSAPKWDGSTVGGEELQVWDALISVMLSNRLTDAINSGQSNLIRGSGGPFRWARQTAFYGFNVDAPDLAAGTQELVGRLNQARIDGFTRPELNRAIQEFDAGQDQALAAISTRQDSQWADLYVSHFLEGADVSSPAESNRRVDGLLDAATPEALSDYYRWLMAQAAPIVIVVGPDQDDLPSVEAVTAAVAAAAGGLEPTDAVDVPVIEQLMDAPEPVEVLSTMDVTDLDAVAWEFENGARVVFRESAISAESVDVWAQSKGGTSLLDPDDQSVAQLASEMVTGSGVGPWSKASLERYMADKVVGLGPGIDETRESLFGSASAEDLEILFQWFHLLLTEPTIDQVTFARQLTQSEEQLRRTQTSPVDASIQEVLEVLNNGNPVRDVTLDFGDLDDLTPERALEIYRSRYVGVDDMVIAVTGDVESEVVLDLARRYIGTLPVRPGDTWQDNVDAPPTGVVTREITVGSGEAAGSYTAVLFGALNDNNENRTGIRVLESILNERLFTEVREALAASYGGGQAILELVTEPDPEARTIVIVVGDADRLDEVRSVVLAQLADLAASGPTNAEFEKALAIVSDDNNFISNQQLQEMLHDYADGMDPLLTTTRTAEILNRLTSADVARLARLMLPTDSWIEVLATPSG